VFNLIMEKATDPLVKALAIAIVWSIAIIVSYAGYGKRFCAGCNEYKSLKEFTAFALKVQKKCDKCLMREKK